MKMELSVLFMIHIILNLFMAVPLINVNMIILVGSFFLDGPTNFIFFGSFSSQ
jgi:hypothetical protein